MFKIMLFVPFLEFSPNSKLVWKIKPSQKEVYSALSKLCIPIVLVFKEQFSLYKSES